MDGSAHFVVGQCRDDTLDLPPVAESKDIAGVAAAFGARRGLQPGIVTEAIDEVRSFVKGCAAGDERRVHGRLLTRDGFPDNRQSWSTDRSPRLSASSRSAIGLHMAKRTPMAGGFLLMAGILIGAIWGVSAGNPMKGILIGTGIGIAIALLVWLVDSRRRPKDL